MAIDPSKAETFAPYVALGELTARQVAASPKHAPFLARRFSAVAPAEMALCEEFAQQIFKLARGEIDDFFKGYDFICDIQKHEEIYFRRHNEYRLKTVSEAIEQVYGNRPYMQAYMRGLLMTQVFWSNHAASMNFFMHEFLASNPGGYDHLEIGPGHGLLFYRALADRRAGSVTGWDLSAASIAETEEALRKLGVTRQHSLQVRDLADSADSANAFDSVVLSEVLEHLEEPVKALAAIRHVMRPNGRLYINVPINSPAPDHIFLLRSPEEAVAFVEQQGFRVERTGFFPATNYSLDAARRHQLTVSVCLIAVKSGA